MRAAVARNTMELVRAVGVLDIEATTSSGFPRPKPLHFASKCQLHSAPHTLHTLQSFSQSATLVSRCTLP